MSLKMSGGLLMAGALMSGCVEGYPPRHHVPLTPYDMSRTERLQVLTDISGRGAGGLAHRFELLDDCSLRLETRPPAKAAAHAVTLKGVYLDMDFDEDLEVFEIGTQPDKHLKVPRTVIIKAAAWTDASFAYKVLRHLQRDCLQGNAAAAAP